MSSKSPSYITKTKHGIYYFQLRVNSSLASRLGIKSQMYRKSLRTKDKKLALISARRLWLAVYNFSILGSPLSDSKNNSFSVDDYEGLKQEDVERSRLIKTAIRYLDMYESIPSWDADSLQQADEYRTQEDEYAIKYCSDNNINLDDYRTKELKSNSTLINHTNAPQLKSEKLDILLDQFIKDAGLEGKSIKTLVTYRGQIKKFVDLFDKPSNEITIEDADYFKFALNKLPKNRNLKKYRSKTSDELLEMDIPDIDQCSSKTKKDTAQRVRTFLKWAITRKYVNPDVLEVLKGTFTTSESYQYAPFDNEDLKKLFLSEGYLGPKLHKKHSYFWLPLLALFTGSRQGELCQLLVSDLHEFEYKGKKHYYLDINDEGDKTLKTRSSKRKVPLHDVLIKLGFLDYVTYVKKNSNRELFPDLLGLTKPAGPTISRWFNEKYKRSCSITDDGKHRKVFHSFRHTLVDHLYQNNKGLPIEKIGDIVGHTHKTVTGRSYVGQGNLSIENRMDIICKINYGVDFSKIRRRGYS